MSSLESTIHALPQPILKKLRAIVWRVRRLLLVRGIFATLAVALICLLSIMAIDATMVILSSAVRWALSLGGVVITVLAGWWFLVRPLSRKLSLTHVARIIEIRHPELQERISTAVELMSSDDPEEIKGSQELIQAVVDGAVIDVEKINPRHEFKAGRAAKFVGIAAACLAVLAAVLLIFPTHGLTLLKRAVAPFLDIGNAYAQTMVISPGDAQIAEGGEITIEMTIAHDKIKRAELRRRLPDGRDSVERMTLMGKTEDGKQRFSMTFPNVEESFAYRVRAGSAVSEYYDITAVPPPSIESLQIRYDYPEYTGLEPVELTDPPSREIRALAHTRVTVTAQTNKPISQASITLNDDKPLGRTEISVQQITTVFSMSPRTSGTWRLDLADADDLTNTKEPHSIVTLPDKSPVVRITNPQDRELRLKPIEVLPMQYEISEDFGFSEIAIVITPDGAATPWEITQPRPDNAPGTATWRGYAPLNLAELDLKPEHRKLQVQLRARDNRPAQYGGPNEGVSEVITILLDRNAKSLAEQTIDSQKRELEKAIREARSDLERAKSDMRNAERELSRQDDVSINAERHLDKFQEEVAKAEDRLTDVAEKLEQSVFSEQADALEQITEEQLAEAKEKADLIPVTDGKRDRMHEAQTARQEVEQALAELRKVEESIRQAKPELDDITQLNEMANDQRQLAQDAQAQAEKEQQLAQNDEQNRRNENRNMEAFQRRQEQLQDKLGDILKDDANALQEVLEERRQEADQLAEAAQQLAKSQEELRKLTLDASASRESPEQENAIAEALKERLQKEQEHIAAETKTTQDLLEKSPHSSHDSHSSPPDPSPLAQAVEQTQKAAEAIAQEDANQAKASAEAAAKALAQAASDQAQKAQSSDNAQPSESADEPNPSQQASDMANAEAQNAEGSDQASDMANAEPQNAEGSVGSDQSDGSDRSEPTTEQKPEPTFADGFAQGMAEAAAERLADLAERQEAIADQIAAIDSGDMEEALSLMEEELAEQSSALSERADTLQETLENLDQRQSRYEANHASNYLETAAKQAQSALSDFERAEQAQARAEQSGATPEGQLAKPTQQALAQAQRDQQQAQRSMDTAARSLEKAANAIGQTLDKLQASQEQDSESDAIADSQQMAESFQDMAEAMQSQNAQQAADRAQQAAESLQQLAQQAMQQLGQMDSATPSEQQSSSQQNSDMAQQAEQQAGEGSEPTQGGQMADATSLQVPPELEDLGISASDWARFRGALSGGSATAIESDLPAEYRELVGRYFQVIAKQANEGE